MPEAVKTWWQRIDEAEARRGFTSQDINAAGSWVDCACGCTDARIPRFTPLDHQSNPDLDSHAPVDGELRELGLRFFEDVRADNYPLARATLRQIETRAAEILREMGYGDN